MKKACRFCHGNREAFTLLELVVAITILSIITSFIYGVYTGSVRTIDKTSEKAELYNRARLVLDRMANELTSAATSVYEPDEPWEAFFMGIDDKKSGIDYDDIAFVTRANRGSYSFNGRPSLTRIEYYLDMKRGERKKNKSERKYTLYRIEDVIFHLEDLDPDKEEEFVDDCRGLNFEYLTKRGWVDEWDDIDGGKQQKGKIPDAVRIKLTLADKGGNEVKLITIVDLPCSR